MKKVRRSQASVSRNSCTEPTESSRTQFFLYRKKTKELHCIDI